MRFKVLEERVKASNGNSKFTVSDGRNIATGPSRRQSFGGAESLSASSSNGYLSRKNSISRSGSLRSNSANVLLKNAKLSSRSFDGGSRNLERERPTSVANGLDNITTNTNNQITSETITTHEESTNGTPVEKKSKADNEDYVSGMLYDMLQKEVISLRKACHEKDQTLKDKDDAIEVSSHFLNKVTE